MDRFIHNQFFKLKMAAGLAYGYKTGKIKWYSAR